MTLLTRMQTSKTAQYEYIFARFILYTMALNIDGLGPDYVIAVIEGIQPKCANISHDQSVRALIVDISPVFGHRSSPISSSLKHPRSRTRIEKLLSSVSFDCYARVNI